MVTYERVVSHRCKIKNVQVPLALLYFLLDPAHRGGHSLESPSVTLPRSCCDLILLIVQAGGRHAVVCVCALQSLHAVSCTDPLPEARHAAKQSRDTSVQCFSEQIYGS